MADLTMDSGMPVQGKADEVPVRRIVAFFFMVVGMFMAILDIQVVSASLSEIQAGLSAGSDEIGWVQTAYLIAEVIMIPLSGTLARVLSTRVLFTVAAAGFTLASALCATATNMDQMIVYRALQGFIGGGMIPSVFAVAFTLFPPSKRAIVSLAAYGAVAAYAYGLATNLWFWPFALGGATQASYVPGGGLGENVPRFLAYTLATSTLSVDTVRAVVTAAGVLVLGRPVLGALRRAHR